jgi:hypothetical protein
MATKLTNVISSVTTTGVKDPSTGSPSLTKFPEGGATFSVEVTAGTGVAATVQLRAWNAGMTNKEILATFVLPVSGGSKNTDTFDSMPIFSMWDAFDWNVVSLSGSATPTLRLSCVGVGV